MTRCTVEDFNGDGISFQQSNEVSVEDCACNGNTHLGLHPGSGSGSPTIRNCRRHGNGRIGLFLCWRVRNGRFENNALLDNGETGISIGHKDTDNTFSNNRAIGNGNEGVLFRDESEADGGPSELFREERNTGQRNRSRWLRHPHPGRNPRPDLCQQPHRQFANGSTANRHHHWRKSGSYPTCGERVIRQPCARHFRPT